MLNRIGYACINSELKPRTFKACRLKSIYKYGIKYLRSAILNNLSLTKDILKWNIENDIYMYRVTSKLLPLVTHPDILKDFDWRWERDEDILNVMEDIKKIVNKNDIRLSMHPDQFTVLNSLRKDVVKNSIMNLHYHYEVLKRIEGNDIIIHTGGVYGDKKASIKRFIDVFNNLDNNIKNMLRLENDDKSYTIKDVLYINKFTKVPIVLDIHHHTCNNDDKNIEDNIHLINKSWSWTGMLPKFHISSGKNNSMDTRHHDFIKEQDFRYLFNLLKDIDFDLMVEAKKKEAAVLNLKNTFNL